MSSLIRIENPLLVLAVGFLLLCAFGAFAFLMVKGLQGIGPAWRQLHRCYLLIAHQLGMEYRPSVEETDGIVAQLQKFRFTSPNLPSTTHRCSTLLEGRFSHEEHTWQATFVDFTSHFRHGAHEPGQAKNVIQTILYLESAAVPPVSFEIRPEGLVQKLLGATGFQDIDFPDYPKFSKLFTLKGEDEQQIRTLFTPSLIQVLEANPGISMESDGQGAFILYREGESAGHRIRRDEASHAEVARYYQELFALGMQIGTQLAPSENIT